MSKTDRTFPNIFPPELRDMIYGFVLGDHTIHIKSDVIPRKSDSRDDKHDDEDDDDDDDGLPNDEEEEEKLAEVSEILNEDRGPLYHSICNKELLQPKDARLYRIRSLEANGSRDSRVQSNMVVKDFKHVDFKNVKYPELSDFILEYETIGSLGGEDKPTVQLKLAFLRVNKQFYQEASRILYSTRTFGFDDPYTFAQFFSIKYNYRFESPTSTNGANLLASKRNSITSVHIRAKTNLWLAQKIPWMVALDGATFVLPKLEKIRVLFDLCYEGMAHHIDGSLWQFWRHCNAFPLLKTAEVRVATHLVPSMVKGNMKDEWNLEILEGRWSGHFVEAIVGHHMDVLFGVSLLDPASVAERDAIFNQPW